MSKVTFEKALIGQNYKALRIGPFVEAAEYAGEFIYEAGNVTDLSVALLQEIAEANKFEIKKSLKKDEYVLALDQAFENSKLPRQNKMTDSQIVEKVITEGMENGKSDDEMLIEIVQEGVKFQIAGKLFKNYMAEKGLRVSNKERNVLIAEMLDEAEFNPETSDDVNKMVSAIIEEVADTDKKQALAGIRKWAKTNDVDLPKATKKAGGGLKAKIFGWIQENAGSADTDGLTEFLTGLEVDEERIPKLVKSHSTILELANNIANG